jgi:hypothetical protein
MAKLSPQKAKYDEKHDVLHLFFSPVVPGDDEEIYPGVFVRRSEIDERISGIVILDYSKRSKKLLEELLPFLDLKKVEIAV